MKKKSFKLMLCACALAISMIPTCALADSGNTDVEITVPASTLSFTVTETITITGTANSNDATVTDLSLNNNASAGNISATLQLQNKTGWAAKAYTTAWTTEAANSKTYGLKADSTKDMYETVTGTAYSCVSALAPGATDKTSFTAKVPIQSTALTAADAATIVTTVSWA